jgi:hypothetical protein
MSEPTPHPGRSTEGARLFLILGIAVPCALAGLAWWLGPHYYREAKDFWNTYVFGRAYVYLLSLVILYYILRARGGAPSYVRRIPGLTAVDETVGRATEMGRPITFSLGLSETLDIIQLQALAIALHVVRLAIQFGTRVIVTMRLPTVFAIASEAIQEAYAAAGRPESFNPDDVRFLSDRQFSYASAMMGTIIRERAASNYMFGQFYAESLILAEAGNQVGAIQVAGTPAITQIPFFVATCDYTIIGDEYYAATAYLTRDPVLSGSLLGQDRGKMLILGTALLGVLAATVLTLAMGSHAAEILRPLTSLFTAAK